MRNHYNSTIAAISTAMSNSGIGIVRMSGPDSFEIADRIYKGKKEKIGKKNNPNLILWVFSHMNIIKHVESQGRKKIYKII